MNPLVELLRKAAAPLLLPAWLLPVGLITVAVIFEGPPRVLFGGLGLAFLAVAIVLTVLWRTLGKATESD